MVNMAHDRNDRSSWLHILRSIFILRDDCLIVERDKMHLAVILGCDDLSGLMIDLLVDSDHQSHLEELRDDIAGLEIHLLRKICDGDVLHDIDGLRHSSKLLLLALLLLELEIKLLIA